MSLTWVYRCDIKGCSNKARVTSSSKFALENSPIGWTVIGSGRFRRFFCPDCSKLKAVKESKLKEEEKERKRFFSVYGYSD